MEEKIVFSNEVGGITEQIIDNKTGFYLTGDKHKDANSIRQVIESPNEFISICDSAHQRVKNRFVLPVMIDGYIAVYNKALNI